METRNSEDNRKEDLSKFLLKKECSFCNVEFSVENLKNHETKCALTEINELINLPTNNQNTKVLTTDGSPLLNMKAKELNKFLDGLVPEDEKKKIKKIRRTYKNRGYALNSRTKRLCRINDLEVTNIELKKKLAEAGMDSKEIALEKVGIKKIEIVDDLSYDKDIKSSEKLQLNGSIPPKNVEKFEIAEIKESLNKKCKKQLPTTTENKDNKLLNKENHIEKEPSSRKKSEENVSKVISNSESEKWKCSQCDSTFKSRNKLINHLKKIKENVPVKHCMICAFKSCSRISMLSHMEKSHVRV